MQNLGIILYNLTFGTLHTFEHLNELKKNLIFFIKMKKGKITLDNEIFNNFLNETFLLIVIMKKIDLNYLEFLSKLINGEFRDFSGIKKQFSFLKIEFFKVDINFKELIHIFKNKDVDKNFNNNFILIKFASNILQRLLYNVSHIFHKSKKNWEGKDSKIFFKKWIFLNERSKIITELSFDLNIPSKTIFRRIIKFIKKYKIKDYLNSIKCENFNH